ncbi:MAG: ROK family glucokinase [Ancrocorticia sp.]|uniref:ROK family glucokinase n=1 Tax=Ancrocorticia sp. TaxID=2593684 RepID=UPI003F91A1FF
MSVTIGVDVGGTKIAAGAVSESGEILAYVRKPTPAGDPDSVVAVITECVNELGKSYEAEAIGIGAAGFVDADRKSVVFAPNLAWRNEPLAVRVSERTGRAVVVENDANAAAWAEFRFGAASGTKSAILVTVGTGIGGGVIMNNQLLRGAHGFAAEIGHIGLVPDGKLCGCGLKGCWEAYSSGNALVRAAREFATESPAVATRLLELGRGKPEGITGLMVTQAAQEGDALAAECFNQIGYYMGKGLADLAALLDPEMFVLAGGVCEAGDLLLDPTRRSFESSLTARTFRPTIPIGVATLGNEAGIIGAADLARS